MNAITPHPRPEDERTARHLALCRELADLAMELARAAARRTLHAWAAEQEAPAGTQTEQPPPPAGKTPDPGLLFTRLSTAARQAITLEARIAAGPAAFAPQSSRTAPRAPPDERRATIRQVLHEATEHHPDRTAFRKEIAERLEEAIAADPEGEIHMGDMLDTICEDLGIEINWSKIRDEVLEKLTAPQPEDEPANEARAGPH